MNFLTIFARNIKNGPYTEAFPFGPAFTPDKLRGRIVFKAETCEGCRICERVCPANAIRFAKTPEGMTFDCWHNTCVFCGNCEFYCPTDAIHQTNDWNLAHVQSEKFDMVEHGLIPNQTCVECGATALNTSPMLKNVNPPLNETEYAELRGRCPKCRAKYLKTRKAKS